MTTMIAKSAAAV